MSSQVKKRFAEMDAYLGKDTKGRELLKQLHDAVNVLRKNLAAATQLADDEAKVKIAARVRADAMATELAQLKLELHSAQQRNTSLQHELNNVIATVAAMKVEAEADPGAAWKSSEVVDARDVFNQLKLIFPQCPEPISSEYGSRRICYYREDFSRGWSGKDLWTLGAAVALLTVLDGQAIIFAESRAISTDPVVQTKYLGFIRALLNWTGVTKDECDSMINKVATSMRTELAKSKYVQKPLSAETHMGMVNSRAKKWVTGQRGSDDEQLVIPEISEVVPDTAVAAERAHITKDMFL